MATTKTTEKNTEIIEIRPLEIVTAKLRLVGDSPLIMHAWSEKAKREMLEKQMKKTKTSARAAKNPIEDFVRSMYWLTPMPEQFDEETVSKAIETAKFGFPVTAFKKAAISAAFRMDWTPNKVGLRGAFFLEGDENQMLEINSDTPIMREDMVKLAGSTADIRYRGEFRNWSTDITIKYNANGQYSLEQIVNVINAGGYVCGVGEWRPEKDGQFGMFHVEVG